MKSLSLLIACVFLGAGGNITADDDPASQLTVRDVSILVQSRNEPRINDTDEFASSLPPAIRSRRPTAKGELVNTPQPIGVVTFEGPPLEDLEISLQLISGTRIAFWPPGNSRSTRLLWPSLHLTEQGDTSPPLPETHWLQMFDSPERVLIRQARATSRMLLYDISLRRPAEVDVLSREGGYRISIKGQEPVHDLFVFRPVGNKWQTASAGTIKPIATSVQEPLASTQVFDAILPGLVGNGGEKRQDEKPPGEASDDADAPAEANVHFLSESPVAKDQAIQPLLDRLEAEGLGSVELEYVSKTLEAHALRKDQATIVYRMDPAALDRLLPLDVIPLPRRVVRVALVIVVGLDPEVEQRVEKLLTQLGNDSWEQREAAHSRLLRLGDAAIPRLKKAESHRDVEIRFRVEQILETLGQDADQPGSP